MEQIDRITEMERILDDSQAVLDDLENALDAFEKNKSEMDRLFAYYSSSLWRKDFEDDEAGLLPKDLKRGVLTEDAVYDLLTSCHSLRTRLRDALFGILPADDSCLMHTIHSFADLDFDRLMSIYLERNLENADDLYPDEPDRNAALRRVVDDFRSYLTTDFFRNKGETYRILEKDGKWVSALRLYALSDRRFYLEALETAPECRREGYATALLNKVIDELKMGGQFVLCDCVAKSNFVSLKTHLSCGFTLAQENGLSLLSGDSNPYTYGMEYRF